MPQGAREAGGRVTHPSVTQSDRSVTDYRAMLAPAAAPPGRPRVFPQAEKTNPGGSNLMREVIARPNRHRVKHSAPSQVTQRCCPQEFWPSQFPCPPDMQGRYTCTFGVLPQPSASRPALGPATTLRAPTDLPLLCHHAGCEGDGVKPRLHIYHSQVAHRAPAACVAPTRSALAGRPSPTIEGGTPTIMTQ